MRSRERFVVCVVAVAAAATGSALAQADVHGTRATAVISRNANGPSTRRRLQPGRPAGHLLRLLERGQQPRQRTTPTGARDVFVLHRYGPRRRALARERRARRRGGERRQLEPERRRRRDALPALRRLPVHGDEPRPARPSPDSDVYVRDLRSRRTRLVSADAPADAFNPAIDGGCRLVDYESAGTVFVADLSSGHSTRIATGQPARPADQRQGRRLRPRRPGLVPGAPALPRPCGEARRGAARERRAAAVRATVRAATPR